MAFLHFINAAGQVNNGDAVIGTGPVTNVRAGLSTASNEIYRGRAMPISNAVSSGNLDYLDDRFKPQHLMDVGEAT